MGFPAYLRTRLWDYLFCLMAAGALSYTLFSGFYATLPLQAWPAFAWPCAACAALMAALLCVSYTSRTAAVGGVVLAAILVAVVVALAAAGPGSNPVDDVEGNYVIAALLCMGSCLAVFLLSRTYPGAVVLAVAGMAACALIEYLYWYGHLWAQLVLFVGVVGLVVIKGYERHLKGSDADEVAFFSVGVMAVALAVMALLVGLGAYALVVKPLDPPRAQVTLVVEHRRVEEVDIVGTGAISADAAGDAGDDANGEDDPTDREADDAPSDAFSGGLLALLGMDIDQTGDEGTTSALERVVLVALLVAGLLLLLVIALIVARKLVRRHRFRKMTSQGAEASVRNLYLFFLERFARMRLVRPDSQSLRDFQRANEGRFAEFERFKPAGGAGMAQLTDAYIGVMYGHEDVDDARLSEFTGYYRLFYKNARRYVGRVRYLGKFFTL